MSAPVAGSRRIRTTRSSKHQTSRRSPKNGHFPDGRGQPAFGRLISRPGPPRQRSSCLRGEAGGQPDAPSWPPRPVPPKLALRRISTPGSPLPRPSRASTQPSQAAGRTRATPSSGSPWTRFVARLRSGPRAASHNPRCQWQISDRQRGSRRDRGVTGTTVTGHRHDRDARRSRLLIGKRGSRRAR